MSLNKRFISMFLSMCVVVTFMFQSVHIYSHFATDFFSDASHKHNHDKLTTQHSDDCQICHFTFSPFISVSADAITFYQQSSYPQLNIAYKEFFIKSSLNFIALRGPPVFV